MRVAVLGGAFDPVHYGHLKSAVEVCESLCADQFYLMPCGQPAIKSNLVASADQRLEMLQLAVSGFENLSIDGRELRRSGASYTYDSLEEIKSSLADEDELFFVMGSDAFRYFHHWYRWREVTRLATLVVMQRAGERLDLSDLDSDLSEWLDGQKVIQEAADLARPPQILILETEPYAVASTVIRESLKERKDASCRQQVEQWLPRSVLDYVDRHALYLVY